MSKLIKAAYKGKLDKVISLLEEGVEIAATDEEGRQALHFAAANGFIDVVDRLHVAGADINSRDKEGRTPLHMAAMSGNLDMFVTLKRRRADLSARDNLGMTPLHLAVWKGNFDLVKYLDSKKVELDIKDMEGRTPLHGAAMGGHLEMVKYLKRKQVDLEARDNLGMSPLHLAVWRGHIDVLRYLERKGVDMQAKDNDLDGPLHLAAQRGHIELVKYAVESLGSDVNEKNKNGMSPLHWAARNGHLAIVQYLESKGADIHARNAEMRTALGLAEHKKHLNVVSFLVEKRSQDLQTLLDDGKREWGRSKIMLVGQGRAGKTALSFSLIGRPFQETESTIGIDNMTCDVKYAAVEQNSWIPHSPPAKELEAAMAKGIVENRRSIRGTSSLKAPLNIDTTHAEPPTEMPMPSPRSSASMVCSSCCFGRFRMRGRSHSQQQAQPLSPVFKHQISAETILTSEHTPIKPPAHKLKYDEDFVMKTLAENVHLETKFVLSVLDFGGQRVFNVIHPFFMTRHGVYFVVFDMQWFLNDDDSHVVDMHAASECLSYLAFWVNSIVVHTSTQVEALRPLSHGSKSVWRTAPLAFIGTHKDKVTSEDIHVDISNILKETFSKNVAWPSVIEYEAKNICFFPVDCTSTTRDAVITALMKRVELKIDKSDYVHEPKPLGWFAILDDINKVGDTSFITYDAVLSLSSQHRVDNVDEMLSFFHALGLLMWHNEPHLRHVVIIRPIDFFVAPASLVICQHTADRNGTRHFSNVHKLCKKEFRSDFDTMVKDGKISEQLLQALVYRYLCSLKGVDASMDLGNAPYDFADQFESIKYLMIKYSLLVPLYDGDGVSEEYDYDAGDSCIDLIYVAPSLLPTQPLRSHLQDIRSSTVYFVFRADQADWRANFNTNELRREGFLPSGLFSRFVAKLVSWIQDIYGNHHNCILYRNVLELILGGHTYRLTELIELNSISVESNGGNVVAVLNRLEGILEATKSECLKSLRVDKVVPYYVQSNSNEVLEFLRLEDLRSQSLPMIVRSTGEKILLSKQEIAMHYGPLCKAIGPHRLTHYDVFISYRWNTHDKNLARNLFDRLSLYPFGERFLDVFLDEKRLELGDDMRVDFCEALINSTVIIPLVTHEALQRLINHDPERVDNLLLEWICAELAYYSGKNLGKIVKIIPIFVGAVQEDSELYNDDLFQSGTLNILPTIRPSATIDFALKLLPADILSHIEKLDLTSWTVKNVIERVVSKNGINTKPLKNFRGAVKVCQENILKVVTEVGLTAKLLNTLDDMHSLNV